MSRAIVIGCGVSGLSSAIRLQESGRAVTIVTRDLPPQTTSVVAAAIWYPYKAFPLERVLDWGRASLDAYYLLMADPETGVKPLTVIQPFEVPAPDPWWREVVRRFERAVPAELPPGMVDGYRFEVPLIETPIYMRYLLRRFERGGGTVRLTEVTDLAALCDGHPLVVNCSGVWARTLAGDEQTYPIRGQVIRVSTGGQPNDRLLFAGLFHDPEDAQPTYAFPRSDGVILGGTADAGQWQTAPDPAMTADIMARVRRLVPGAGTLNVLDVQAGLRPGRHEVRLDIERIGSTTVIHNYGHGGAGFTLSWGCADEVASRADRAA